MKQTYRWRISKLLMRSWFFQGLEALLRGRERSIRLEEMFEDSHDKEHRYQDCGGNKPNGNRVHWCPYVLLCTFAINLRSWTRIYVPWRRSFGIKSVHPWEDTAIFPIHLNMAATWTICSSKFILEWSLVL